MFPKLLGLWQVKFQVLHELHVLVSFVGTYVNRYWRFSPQTRMLPSIQGTQWTLSFELCPFVIHPNTVRFVQSIYSCQRSV